MNYSLHLGHKSFPSLVSMCEWTNSPEQDFLSECGAVASSSSPVCSASTASEANL